MLVHDGYEDLNLIAPVATLGIFDGVHQGHKALLDHLVKRAGELKGESVVITFSPHPRYILERNNMDLSLLTTMEEKTVLLRNAGIDHLIVIEFNEQFSKINACDFIQKILVEKIGIKNLIIGFNHHFGWRGEGDFSTIQKCSETLNFKVEQILGYHSGESAISSSSIREALLNGRLDEANNWLGYSYFLGGKVVEGRKIGRRIGFPTANILPDSKFKLIPANGVYAVEANIENIKYPGMLSIGSNPTVNSDFSIRSIEVHIFNFDNDIYGKKISVAFRKRLRDEKKFDNIDQLRQQMELDRLVTLQLLSLK